MKYRTEFVEAAAKYSALGATHKTLATIFGVCEDTIGRWRKKYPAFREAIEGGARIADFTVEVALYRKAVGYEETVAERITVRDRLGNESVVVVPLKKTVPPDTTAAIFWLRNRRPDLWREKASFAEESPLTELLDEIVNDSRGLPSQHHTANRHRP